MEDILFLLLRILERGRSTCVGLVSGERRSGIQPAKETEWTVGVRHLPRTQRAGKTQVHRV